MTFKEVIRVTRMGDLARRFVLLTAIRAHQLGAGEDMPLHCLLEFLFSSSRLKIQLGVECGQSEEIAVRLACRWTRASVTDFAETVSTLSRAVREFVNFVNVLRQAARTSRQIE